MKAQRSIKAHPTKAHRLVIQVDQNDPAVTNVIEYYRAKGEDVDVDVITYAACTCACRYIAGTGPHQDLKDLAFPSKIQFSACGNAKEGMEKKEGHPITVLSEAVVVPSGVVRLMELQEKGWSYVRP